MTAAVSGLALCIALGVACNAQVAVTGVEFGPVVSASGHGDNWHMTWAEDGRQYTALGDGKGWDNTVEHNTRVWALTGGPADFKPVYLKGYPDIPGERRRWYGYGLLALDDHIYHFISHAPEILAPFNGTRLVYSRDRGETWAMADGSEMRWPDANASNMLFWGTPDSPFSLVSVLQYGRNYRDNKDGYVYLYSPNGFTDARMRELVLARVPKERITDRNAYEYFVSRNVDGSANWAQGDIAKRGVVHQFPAGWVASNLKYSWHPSVVYIKALELYVMAAAGTGRGERDIFNSPSYLGIYTARTPWGPWTQVHENSSWTVSGDGQSRPYEPVIAPQWISEDGSVLHLVYSDAKNWPDYGNLVNYKLNVQRVTLKTSGALSTTPSVAAVAHGASLSTQSIAPGQIVSVFGSKLGPESGVPATVGADNRLPKKVADVSMTVNGIPAPLLYVSAGQLNAVIPFGVSIGSKAVIQTEYKGVRSDPMPVDVAASSPGIFVASGAGTGQAVAQNYEDGILTMNSPQNAAPKGSIVILQATGAGQTDPASEDGLITADVHARPTLPVRVTIGGAAAQVLYAGAAPGAIAGVLQLNVVVPEAAVSGDAVPVVLHIGDVASRSGVTLAVR